jgi:hypothetical protein
LIYRVVDKHLYERNLKCNIRDWIPDLIKMSDLEKRVLFICTHNSARSQKAEGLMNGRMGDKLKAESAGTELRKVNACALMTRD